MSDASIPTDAAAVGLSIRPVSLFEVFGCVSGFAIGFMFLIFTLGAIGTDDLANALDYRPEGAWMNLAMTAASFMVLLIGVAVAMSARGRDAFTALGFARFAPAWWWRAPALALSAHALALSAAYLAGWGFGRSADFEVARLIASVTTTVGTTAGAVAVIGVFAPLAEEVAFRGFLWSYLRARTGFIVSAATTTALFACAHIEPAHILVVMPAGIAFAVIRERAGSIWPCVIGHAAINSLLVVYFHLSA